MSTFDNPFDPNRRLHAGGCSCGRHLSEAEHQAASLQTQAAIESELSGSSVAAKERADAEGKALVLAWLLAWFLAGLGRINRVKPD